VTYNFFHGGRKYNTDSINLKLKKKKKGIGCFCLKTKSFLVDYFKMPFLVEILQERDTINKN